ncbi:glycine--tRNA ligase [bacterium]|nr:glycine--tRNA ligase [bacterium]MDP6571559.1 glycine--tRNA ligase [Patescibacteria group bacterium]MDP6756134.1 glycine--tRNA ligase [Patescibacteria group bacterium]|tara:strand:+ start:12722 stop:14038 length:1317 start_codon:yes stop_codon:yes gene_type:complete
MAKQDLMEKIVSLAKQRGFIYPGSEIYGGLQNSWDYGPLGVELKNNIKALWWDMFVRRRDDIVGMDAALIMNPKVWIASGHVSEFNDPMVECKKCHSRFRADHLKEKKCPECGGGLTEEKQFNMMFKTHLGPVADKDNEVYLRPETAQAIFVDFKNVLQTSRQTLPFGIAQIGKAFRNEITPGNFIFRTREFEQMEIEYFIKPPKDDKDWQKPFNEWVKAMHKWIDVVGINKKKIHELDVPKDELAHYSKKTIDFEFDFPFGKDELYGLAYRYDFDLKNHQKNSGQDTKYRDQETGEEFWPHVIEPSLGVDRTLLAVLVSAYHEEGEGKDKRVVLKLKPQLAPYKVAVFPLMRNKPELVEKAQSIYKDLRSKFMIAWDDRGNIGKRYYSQDQIGTPFCITIDFDTLDDDTVTIRERDTAEQERVPIKDLESRLQDSLK